MTLPARYDLTIKRGATFQRWFALRGTDGQVIDLATAGDGYTIGTLIIRPTYDGPELVKLTTDNGGISLVHETDADGRPWSGYLSMTASAAQKLIEWGEGVYDFEISDGFHEIPVFEGRAVLAPTTITS